MRTNETIKAETIDLIKKNKDCSTPPIKEDLEGIASIDCNR